MSQQVLMLQQKLMEQTFTADSSIREVALLRDQFASMTSSLAAAQVNNQHMSMILEASNAKAQMLLSENVRLQTLLSQMSNELTATRNHRDDALEQFQREQGKNKVLSAKLSVMYASKSQPPVQPVELAPLTEVSTPVQEQPVHQVEAQVVQVQVQEPVPVQVQVQVQEPVPEQAQEPVPEQVQEPTPDNAFFESILHSISDNAVSKADFKAHKAELAAKREVEKAARAAKHEAEQAELATKREMREAEQAAKAAEKLRIQEQQAMNLAYKARRRAETQDMEDKIKARKAEQEAILEAKKEQDLKDHRARVAEAKKADTLRRKGLTGQSKPQLDADKTEVTKEQAARALREQQALIAEAIQKCSPKPVPKKAGVLAAILDSELGLKGSAMHEQYMDTPETFDALSDHVPRRNVTGPPAIPSGAVFESGICDQTGMVRVSGRSYKTRTAGQAPCSPCELLQYRIVSMFGLKSFVITESRGWGWRLKCMFEELGGPEKHFFTLATVNLATMSSWIDQADFQKLCKRFAVGMTERAKVLTGDAFNVQRETIKKYLALVLPEMKHCHQLMEVVELEELDFFGLPLIRVSAGRPPRTDRISMWDLVDWYENGTFHNMYTYPDCPVI